MHFVISREKLLKPLQTVCNVVERRQTLPILSNLLMVLKENRLALTGTDLEVEMEASVEVDEAKQPGEITVPGRKLYDICNALGDNADVEMSLSGEMLEIKSRRSRFRLSTLPATDFPRVEKENELFSLSLAQSDLRGLLQGAAFAMAQQDVRTYLNGMLIEVGADFLRGVATDGHRLAMETLAMEIPGGQERQQILPHKGVMELTRLLEDSEGEVELGFEKNHLWASIPGYQFASKLLDSSFPDYNRVLPKGGDKVLKGSCVELRQAFNRARILSNEKYRGVRLLLSPDQLKIQANNPAQEEAEEIVSVEYQGDLLEIGFNVEYLIDALTAMARESARFTFLDSNSSALIEAEKGDEESKRDALYVVMPMRL